MSCGHVICSHISKTTNDRLLSQNVGFIGEQSSFIAVANIDLLFFRLMEGRCVRCAKTFFFGFGCQFFQLKQSLDNLSNNLHHPNYRQADYRACRLPVDIKTFGIFINVDRLSPISDRKLISDWKSSESRLVCRAFSINRKTDDLR